MFRFLIAVNLLPLTWTVTLPNPVQVGEFVQSSCNDLDFGVSQLQQFMRDRPATADIIKQNAKLRSVLIWQFAGQLKGERKYWDHREPRGIVVAEHLPAMRGFPSVIRVSKKQSPLDQCAALLFELFNDEADSEYQRLLLAPPDGRKSKDEFVRSILLKEFKAGEKVKWFFIRNPIQGTKVSFSDWYTKLLISTLDFDTYAKDVKANKPDYLKNYEAAYDVLTDSK